MLRRVLFERLVHPARNKQHYKVRQFLNVFSPTLLRHEGLDFQEARLLHRRRQGWRQLLGEKSSWMCAGYLLSLPPLLSAHRRSPKQLPDSRLTYAPASASTAELCSASRLGTWRVLVALALTADRCYSVGSALDRDDIQYLKQQESFQEDAEYHKKMTEKVAYERQRQLGAGPHAPVGRRCCAVTKTSQSVAGDAR